MRLPFEQVSTLPSSLASLGQKHNQLATHAGATDMNMQVASRVPVALMWTQITGWKQRFQVSLPNALATSWKLSLSDFVRDA